MKSTKILSIRPIDVVFSDETGAYFETGAEIGEQAIVSPVQAAFDGMILRVQERSADGTLINEPKTDGLLQSNASSGVQETAQ
jgi:hypothetical protein